MGSVADLGKIMISFSARITKDNKPETDNWAMINQIVVYNMPDDMIDDWVSDGYEGLFSAVPKYFGMNRMYRTETSHVTFEFTDEQWVMFLLRWT